MLELESTLYCMVSYVFKIQQTIQKFPNQFWDSFIFFVNRFWPKIYIFYICYVWRLEIFVIISATVFTESRSITKIYIWYSSYFLFNTSLCWMYKHIYIYLYIYLFTILYRAIYTHSKLFLVVSFSFFQNLMSIFFIWNNKKLWWFPI